MIHATQSKNPEFWIGFTDILLKMPSAVFPTNQAQTIFSEPLGHGESVGVLRFEIHWEMVELDIQMDIPVYRALVYYRYTVSAHIEARASIFRSGFLGGPLIKFIIPGLLIKQGLYWSEEDIENGFFL